MRFNNLPNELKHLPQWVLWKKEERDGRTTKIPYQVNGTRASATNPNTWSSFEEVCKAYESGLYNGIGYVFSANDPYTGIDLDECIINGELTDEASQVIEQLNSYTEYSQSKKGVHIIVKAQKPGDRNRKGKYEIYDRDRFFVMTAEHVKSTPLSVEERQSELNTVYDWIFQEQKPSENHTVTSLSCPWLSDEEILQKAQNAKNGKKFIELYCGDTSSYDNDDSAADLALCDLLAFWTRDFDQIDRIFRGSGLMRAKWERTDYRERTIRKALESVTTQYENKKNSPKQEGEDVNTSSIAEKLKFKCSDLGNAKRFIDQFGHQCMYIYPFKQWFIWNGSHWERDQNGGMMRLAEKVVETMGAEAEDQSKAVKSHALRSQSLAAMKNMIDTAKSKLHTLPHQLDQHHWLLNVQNGTINLNTGELQPHDRAHYLTQMAGISYDKEATAPLWESFLKRIMDNNTNLIRFIQKAVGYALTGSVREQCIFLLHGGGQNGKSTFLDILEKLMGSYSKTLLAKSLMVKKNEGVNNDIADLKGARLVTTSEGEQGQYLAESLVKQLTGGDRRKARFLFGEYFEYEPTDKIWFMTNHKPIIKGNDEGIWRRIFLLPFSVMIPKEERDKDLKEKLLKEISGILNWAIEGCLLYQKEGLNPPAEVLAANEAYRAEMDTLSAFIEEYCIIDEKLKMPLKELYTGYKEWAEENGLRPLSSRRLKQQLKERGFDARNASKNQVYVFGLGSKDENDPLPPYPGKKSNKDNQRDKDKHININKQIDTDNQCDMNKPSDPSSDPEPTEKVAFIMDETDQTKTDNTQPINYVYVTDSKVLEEHAPVYKTAKVMAVDTETTGVDPFNDKVRLVQLAVPDHPTLILDIFQLDDQGKELLREILTDDQCKILHNAKFDIKMLQTSGFSLTGKLFDTMVASQLLTAGTKKKGHSLLDVVKTYLGEGLSKEEQRSDWSTDELTREQLQYASNDAQILLRLHHILEQQLKEAGLIPAAQLEFDCLFPVASMEMNGMSIDQNQLTPLAEELLTTKEQLESTLGKSFPQVNLNSPKQVLESLQNQGIELQSTNRETLKPLVNQYPVIKDFLEYKKVTKLISAFSDKLPQHIHPITGRIHPQYNQMGADTGRFSCSKPNLQQIPRANTFRSCFVASPGHKLIIADYSQIELRVAAELSQDQRMIQAYKEELDLHALTASLVTDRPLEEVTKEERQAAKAINFGLIYAMGAEGLKNYAYNTYGVKLTLEEPELFRDRFFQAYAGLYDWHQEIRQNTPKETRTLSGRRRQWIHQPPLTALYNTPVQGTAADIVKRALVLLHEGIEHDCMKIMGCVHDEIILEVREDKAEEAAHLLQERMIAAGQEYVKSVPIMCEATITENWAGK